MNAWLSCKISPGQFSGEFAVRSTMFDNTEFSLFAAKEDLRFDSSPNNKRPVKGGIRVTIIQEEDEFMMVTLPRPTFENGQMVTVKKDQVEIEKAIDDSIKC